jgi:hypothetical protein
MSPHCGPANVRDCALEASWHHPNYSIRKPPLTISM